MEYLELQQGPLSSLLPLCFTCVEREQERNIKVNSLMFVIENTDLAGNYCVRWELDLHPKG